MIRAVIEHTPKTIALIDGVFAQSPAVRHKEILWAMSRGVHVYGAASMGAIRAAELEDFGMIGYGKIFRWYRRTPFADDADVAVAMAPAQLGSFPLGVALIDVRLTLKKAARLRIIDSRLQLALETLARSIHYTEMTYQKLLSNAVINGIRPSDLDRITNWLTDGRIQQKSADAIALFKHLAQQRHLTKAHNNPRPFEATEAFAHDMAYYDLADEVMDARNR
nr:TfuA-like protein [Paracoccus aestuariivivens]